MAYGLRWAMSVSTKRVAVLAETTENVIQDNFANAPSFGLGIACCCKVAMTELWFAHPASLTRTRAPVSNSDFW